MKSPPRSRKSKPSTKIKRGPKTAVIKDRYPAPQEMGGQLIRTLLRSMRSAGFQLPLTSHILCACSGGADSTALAVLLMRYGRRVGTEITLLHVNHGWRGEESDGDEAFVAELAKKGGAGFISRRLVAKPSTGESWEAHARTLRKQVFREESARLAAAPVLTAHSADDQAETRLWRFLTGASKTHGQGILLKHGVEIRPLLTVRRESLRVFLREENAQWREDSSNFDARFLRARMRRDLMPVIESIFPGAVDAIIASVD